MQRVLLITLIFTLNTWALKDRALFSINGEILFTNDVNFILKSYDYSRCLIGKNNFISLVTGIGSKVEYVEATPVPLDADQRLIVLKALELNKVMAIENEFLETPKLGKCKVPKQYLSKVYQIYNANRELIKRHESYKSENNDVSMQSYKSLIFKPIQTRLFL